MARMEERNSNLLARVSILESAIFGDAPQPQRDAEPAPEGGAASTDKAGAAGEGGEAGGE